MKDSIGSTGRRYLLGEASDAERDALEQAYFGDAEALGRIEAEEEALIEDYLRGRLDSRTRESFEKGYLASSVHRRRLETMRHLSSRDTAGRILPARQITWRMPQQWLAVAATLVLAVGSLVLLMRRTPDRPAAAPPPAAAGTRSASNRPATPATASPRLFAFSLPPVSTRSGDDHPPLVIPSGTDVVALQLALSDTRRRVEHGRAEIRTVNGDEVWRADIPSAPDASITVSVEVPAATLRVDDYVVALFERRAGGAEQERDRYFLRVR